MKGLFKEGCVSYKKIEYINRKKEKIIKTMQCIIQEPHSKGL